MSCHFSKNILELPDDLLLTIFSYLSSYDLLHVIECCYRFKKIGKDHTLWDRANFKDGRLTAVQIHRKVLNNLHCGTTYVHFRGHKNSSLVHKRKSKLLTPKVLKELNVRCPRLEEFVISNAIVDASKVNVMCFTFVSNVTSLSIVNCEFINIQPITKSYFKNACSILPNLKHLEISNCKWINDSDLMALSKFETLTKLNLQNNVRIGISIPYLAISFRYGFVSLEELDLRGTSLENKEVQSIIQNGKLKCLNLGPIGRVRRENEDLFSVYNLVMSDPQHSNMDHQKVVVIDIGANGPQWRQVDDSELHTMGLQWVKGAKKCQDDSDTDHYFIGKDGKQIKEPKPSSSGINQQEDLDSDSDECENDEFSDDDILGHNEKLLAKRKISDNEFSDDEVSEDNKICSKRRKVEKDSKNDNGKNSDTEREEALNDNCAGQATGTLPDRGLSDQMIVAFRKNTHYLEKLVLAGCAITNKGLNELVTIIPSLQYIDVRNTEVTKDCVDEVLALKPHLNIIFEDNNKCR